MVMALKTEKSDEPGHRYGRASRGGCRTLIELASLSSSSSATLRPRQYRLSQAERTDVRIEPDEGGRWFEVNADGGTCDWGQVRQSGTRPARSS